MLLQRGCPRSRISHHIKLICFSDVNATRIHPRLLPESVAPECVCMRVHCRISVRKQCKEVWLLLWQGSVVQIVSTMGTTRLEDVAEASKGSPLLIFQLYVQRDRDFTASLLRSKQSLEFSTKFTSQNAAEVTQLLTHSTVIMVLPNAACMSMQTVTACTMSTSRRFSKLHSMW